MVIQNWQMRQGHRGFLKHPNIYIHVYFMIARNIIHTSPELGICNSVENTGPDTIRIEAQASQLVGKRRRLYPQVWEK